MDLCCQLQPQALIERSIVISARSTDCVPHQHRAKQTDGDCVDAVLPIISHIQETISVVIPTSLTLWL